MFSRGLSCLRRVHRPVADSVLKGILKLARALGVAEMERKTLTYKEWWEDNIHDIESAKRNVYETHNEEDFRSRGWAGDPQSLGAKHFIEMGQLSRHSVVLEIGCGVARIGRELAPHVREWHGVDISRKMLEYAKERTGHLSNAYLHELNEISLPMFAEEIFDFVYCTIVFMHLDKEDMYQYLKESFRVLKPGALAYFDTWNLLNDNIFDHFLQTQSYNIGDRKVRNRNQYSTPQEFRKYLERVGFEVIDLREEELIKALCKKPRST